MPEWGRERFLATWGVWFHETMTGQAQAAFQRADELLAIARELNTTDLLVEAYHARTPGLLRAADYPALKESAQQVIRLYDRERDRDHAFYFGGHDSRVCAQSFYAISLWGLGFPDQAQEMAWQCIQDARNLAHAFSLAHSLNMGGLTHLLLKDIDACRKVTEELYPLAERNKFPWPLIYARFRGDGCGRSAETPKRVLKRCCNPPKPHRPQFSTLSYGRCSRNSRWRRNIWMQRK